MRRRPTARILLDWPANVSCGEVDRRPATFLQDNRRQWNHRTGFLRFPHSISAICATNPGLAPVPPVTKADIVDRIAEGTGLTKVETKAVVEGFMTTVQEAMDDWQTWADGYWLDYLAGGTNWRTCLDGGTCQVDTDWTDLSFQNAYANVVDISARGGGERTQFYASGSYTDEKGVADEIHSTTFVPLRSVQQNI